MVKVRRQHVDALEAMRRRLARHIDMAELSHRYVPKYMRPELAILDMAVLVLTKEWRSQMAERTEVVIPAGTLIHIGGLPFEIKLDTTAYGTAENLAEGLRALSDGNHGAEAERAVTPPAQ